MRITISHNKKREEVIKIVDRSLDDIIRGVPLGPIQIADEKRTWKASHLDFSLVVRMGFFSAPVRGTADVTDQDVTLDIELPAILGNLIPEEKVRASIEGKVRGLLSGGSKSQQGS